VARQKFAERKLYLVGETQRDLLIALARNLPIDPVTPLEVVIRERVKVRKPDQNALMWAGPLRDIAEQAWLDGKQFTAETWAYFFKREFLPEDDQAEGLVKDGYRKWAHTPDGERILVGSTAQLTVRGFSQYLEQIHAFGANLGVRFSAPPQKES
jgi:hypothetical protein